MTSNRQCILFLVPYPQGTVASQRFRFEQYIPILVENGFQVTRLPFFSASQYIRVNSRANPAILAGVLIVSFIKRIVALLKVPGAAFVFIHREATPAGPPVIEWIIARLFRKKIIYDFDDAIWLTDNIHESRIASFFRWRQKASTICSLSYRVSCGNAYLAAFARKFNTQVTVNPTTIDTETLHNPALYKLVKKEASITIGWTGTHSTLKYLQMLIPVFQHLQSLHKELRLLVIADRQPDIQISNLKFVPWNKETEAEDLLKLDIGVMPLPDNAWSKGKCGFKALQYMAMEIPCVASPVGVNTEIIEHGITGYLATTPQQWIDLLDDLIRNENLREKIGKAGRQKVLARYSVTANRFNFLSLFEKK